MEFLRYTEIKKFDTELQEGQEYCKDWNCFSRKNTVVNSKWNQNNKLLVCNRSLEKRELILFEIENTEYAKK